MATITCRDCGTQRHKVPANTKLCRPCGVLRDATFYRDQERSCIERACDERFTPLHRGDRVCGKCDLTLHQGHCNWCEHDDRELVAPDLALCMQCAKDPVNRRRLIQALRRKQVVRRETNGWTGEELADVA